MSSAAYLEQVERLCTGATRKRISRSNLATIGAPIPPLEEQRRIVSILDEAHDALAHARANVEANLADAQTLRDFTLGKLFANLKAECEMLRLDEVAREFGRGKSKHRPRNDPSLYGGDYPFIQTGDVRNSDRTISTFGQTYNEKGLRQSKLWPKGTVCITIAANIAETAVLGFDACFPDSIIGMVPDESKSSASYVEYALQAAKLRLQERGQGAAQDNINLATFETERFPFPNRDKQNDVVAKLNRMRDGIGGLEANWTAQLANLEALQQSLLAKAFRGELT